MSNENSGDRSFLLCELAAILAMLASAPMAAAQTDTEQAATLETAADATKPFKPGSCLTVTCSLIAEKYSIADLEEPMFGFLPKHRPSPKGEG